MLNINYLTIGVGAGLFLTYCIYFDHKRRQDPLYQEKVRQRRENARQAKEKENKIELPNLDDKRAVEEFFIKQIEIGEELIQAGDIDRGVVHFSYAVALCPQPNQLLSYMKEILPTNAFSKLTEQLVLANKRLTENDCSID